MAALLGKLTGVNPQGIDSRNSAHPDALKAAAYISELCKDAGADVEEMSFRPSWAPNVLCTFTGTEQPDKFVVVGAHFDSRGRQRESTTERAPGANDDGSGTAALLAIAHAIKEEGAQFKQSIILGFWSGEEQGLVGSKAYAQRCKQDGVDIVAMLQADMIAYRVPTEGIQCAFPTSIQDQILTDLCMALMEEYTPSVETCYTPACCSDHQSFIEQGYSATQFFERCGSIADPMYHNPGDLVDRTGFDLEEQMTLISKALGAIAAEIAIIQDGP
jgi:hypothetical protein